MHPRQPISRRRALKLAAVTGTGLAAAGLARSTATAAPDAGSAGRQSVFLHGVASGDPRPDAVVLWTRATPTPASTPGSGVGPAVTVEWEVAREADFQRIVRRGEARTGPEQDHTVKVDADGLEPATTYWYRFRLQGATSPAGRTRTAPAADAEVSRLRMAVVSCANMQAGWFTAYRHLAARHDLDLVVHLGDYFYEYGPGQVSDLIVRPHDPPWETVSLSDYRRRHAQYKADADLQALHAAAPWVITWDDHESANDAWSGGAANHTPGAEGEWSARRAAAQQAYAEWMPVRFGPDGQIYRRLRFGRLASLSMLDLRTYRDEQASSLLDPALDDPDRTITGSQQMNFLLDGLEDETVQWKLVGNPVMITPISFPGLLDIHHKKAIAELIHAAQPGAGMPYNIDQWDGYRAERGRLFGRLRDRGVTGAVFLTGDVHSGWAADLPTDPGTYPDTGESVGVELVCTSLTSDNIDDILGTRPRTGSLGVERAIKLNNPHVKYVDLDSHGFSVLEVTPKGVQMDWHVLIDRLDPESAAVWSTSWRVPAGSTRVEQAARRLS
jgi:alkaline phosphatase D